MIQDQHKSCFYVVMIFIQYKLKALQSHHYFNSKMTKANSILHGLESFFMNRKNIDA
jgi:hypothetical protein